MGFPINQPTRENDQAPGISQPLWGQLAFHCPPAIQARGWGSPPPHPGPYAVYAAQGVARGAGRPALGGLPQRFQDPSRGTPIHGHEGHPASPLTAFKSPAAGTSLNSRVYPVLSDAFWCHSVTGSEDACRVTSSKFKKQCSTGTHLGGTHLGPDSRLRGEAVTASGWRLRGRVPPAGSSLKASPHCTISLMEW